MSELRFHRAARIELAEASYILRVSASRLWAPFEAEFDAVVARVVESPGSGGLLPGHAPELEVRAFHFKTFRNALIVATVEGVRIVYAVALHHRRPGYWTDRVK